MSAAAAPSPLVVQVAPIAGESLLSLIARAAHANVFPRLSDLLSQAGLLGHPAFLPFRAGESDVAALGALLSVKPQIVLQGLHRPAPATARRDEVSWSGGRLEQRFIERRERRISPASLAHSAHHRLAWTNRALSFCPQSFELLISSCPACSRALGWMRTQGLDRCESCRASLLEAKTSSITPSLWPTLAKAAALVDADPAVRMGAIGTLPSAFLGFDPGEAFAAAVELGTAWVSPHASRGSHTARRLATGALPIPAQALALGYDILQGWPASYAEVIGRIRRAQQAAAEASLALRDLGVLGRWFDSRLKETAFGRLLRAYVEGAAEQGGSPHKRPGRAPAGPEAAVVTLTEASELFGISKATLARLVPDGACLIAGRLGRGGAVRFRADALRQSVHQLRGALTPVKVGAVLGVPTYCLPAFADAGLLSRVSDPDAARLAGGAELYERGSLEALLERLFKQADKAQDTPAPLAPLVRRLFCPADWAHVFQALVSGELRQGERREVSGTAALLSLTVEAQQARAMLFERRGADPAIQATLTAHEAALLLGISAIYIPELIDAKLLRAQRDGRSWRIDLIDLVALDRDYALSLELAEDEAFGDGPVWCRRYSDVVVRTRHLAIYRRADGNSEDATQGGTGGAPAPVPALSLEAALRLHAAGKGRSPDAVSRMLKDLRGYRL